MSVEQTSSPAPADEVVRLLLDGIAALAKGRSATDAMEASLLARLVDESGAREATGAEAGMIVRSVAAELGALLRVTDRTVERRIDDAVTLVHAFPAVHASLARGEITKAHAAVIVDAGLPLTEDARTEFVDRALDLARAESPNRLRGMLATIAEQVQERGITERHREARKARAVWLTEDADGMSTLHAHLPAVIAHGAMDRLTELSRADRDSSRSHGAVVGADGAPQPSTLSSTASPRACETGDSPDDRTLDQRRADVLGDLLLAGAPTTLAPGLAAIRGHVVVTVPAATLAGLADSGAELAGVGPVDADAARLLASTAPGWDRVVLHPVTGCVLATDRYRPTAEIRRALRARDVHCRFPGCRQPSRKDDLDHGLAWADGGKTTVDNLAHLCRRHHTLKHAKGWRIVHRGGGVLEWTSPLGRTYVDEPVSTVRFRGLPERAPHPADVATVGDPPLRASTTDSALPPARDSALPPARIDPLTAPF